MLLMLLMLLLPCTSVPANITAQRLAMMGGGGAFNHVQFYCFNLPRPNNNPNLNPNYTTDSNNNNNHNNSDAIYQRIYTRVLKILEGSSPFQDGRTAVDYATETATQILAFRDYEQHVRHRQCIRTRDLWTHYIMLSVSAALSLSSIQSSGGALPDTIALQDLKTQRYQAAHAGAHAGTHAGVVGDVYTVHASSSTTTATSATATAYHDKFVELTQNQEYVAIITNVAACFIV